MWDEHNTRKPILSLRLSGLMSLRADERALSASLFQEPPRTTRAKSQAAPRRPSFPIRQNSASARSVCAGAPNDAIICFVGWATCLPTRICGWVCWLIKLVQRQIPASTTRGQQVAHPTKIRRRYAAHSEQQFSASASSAPVASYSMGDEHNTRKPIPSKRASGSTSRRADERALTAP
jgi:hypothetical protein